MQYENCDVLQVRVKLGWKKDRGGSRRVAKYLQESILITFDLIWKSLLFDRHFATLLLDLPLKDVLNINIDKDSRYKRESLHFFSFSKAKAKVNKLSLFLDIYTNERFIFIIIFTPKIQFADYMILYAPQTN